MCSCVRGDALVWELTQLRQPMPDVGTVLVVLLGESDGRIATCKRDPHHGVGVTRTKLEKLNEVPNRAGLWNYRYYRVSVPHWFESAVSTEILVEEAGAREPHPIAIINGRVRIEQEFVKHLRGEEARHHASNPTNERVLLRGGTNKRPYVRSPLYESAPRRAPRRPSPTTATNRHA